MSDLLLALAWGAVLAGGLGACVLLHRLGVSSTHVRDLLHVGTGVWVIGWPWWRGVAAPLAIVGLALAGALAMPHLAPRVRPARRLLDAVTGEGERWEGIVLYVAAYAALTGAGLLLAPLAAAAALWSLSLGDGLGGLVGRRVGRLRYRTFGKHKTVEGSVVVALASAAAIGLAAWCYGAAVGLGWVAAAACAAALVEALAPAAWDNVLLPGAVFALLLAA